MSAAVATAQGGALALAPNQATWTPQQLAVVKQLGMEDASQEDLQVFLHVCQRTRLDPFAKQIYGITRLQWNPRTKRKEPKLTIQTGIDGFRLIAQRPDVTTGKASGYQGRVGPQWCGEDGVWREVWADAKPPVAARVGVWKEGFREPLFAVAHYAEYVQTRAGDNGPVPNDMWSRMPANQLGKCAEAAAIRAAWPQDLSGIYTPEEIGRADRADGAVLSLDAVEAADPTLSPEEVDLGNQVQACEQTLQDGTLDEMRAVVPELKRLYSLAAKGRYDTLVAHISASGRRAAKLIKEAEDRAAAAAKAGDPASAPSASAEQERGDAPGGSDMPDEVIDAEIVDDAGAELGEQASTEGDDPVDERERQPRSPAQQQRITKLFAQKGIPSGPASREFAEQELGIVIEDPNQLSAAWADRLIEVLEKLPNAAPAARAQQ